MAGRAGTRFLAGVLDFNAVFQQIVADALARHSIDHRAFRTQFDMGQHNDLRHTISV
jgi:hypothetical protein